MASERHSTSFLETDQLQKKRAPSATCARQFLKGRSTTTDGSRGFQAAFNLEKRLTTESTKNTKRCKHIRQQTRPPAG
jgi:hypothetical protein